VMKLVAQKYAGDGDFRIGWCISGFGALPGALRYLLLRTVI
jgi:hypothetical protein